ncbi:hypothetical protein F6X40_11180 [Paraburkholderia sp. UCT31]|uniref:hypothetical protein n=1 Tax=Paraburkholderia sp. UCT31 TaxID=2615209 RepID=UPI0016558611|nr:hypothetical protein [Paraburkholderia sp. UCT31]MBC8737366.1 hypothetical protein [Paraburkholderia sp. UCT31]
MKSLLNALLSKRPPDAPPPFFATGETAAMAEPLNRCACEDSGRYALRFLNDPILSASYGGQVRQALPV